MDEFQIARSTAAILDRLSNGGSSGGGDDDGGHDYHQKRLLPMGEEEVQLVKLKTMTYELAASRARATSRDFNTVYKETEFRVTVHLASILAGTVDPVLGGLEKVDVGADEEEVCGVCQDEMDGGDEVRAMGCSHKFHAFCIWKWLREKNSCPLCRFSH